MRIKMKVLATFLISAALSSVLSKRHSSSGACESLSGSTNNQTIKDIDLKIQNCSDAFGEALNSFETEINSLRTPSRLFEASQRLQELKDLGIDYQKLFFMTSFRSFERRSNLPPVQKFIKQKKTHMRNLLEIDVLSHLLQNTAKLIRITEIICEDKECGKSATRILLKYQDLIRYISRGIQGTLRKLSGILKRNGYAYRAAFYGKNSTKAFNEYAKITTKVKEIHMVFEKVVTDLRAIREELISLFKLTANDFGLILREQDEEFKRLKEHYDLIKKMKRKRIELQNQGFEMNKIVRQLKWKTYILSKYSQSSVCEGKHGTDLLNLCKTFNLKTRLCDKSHVLNNLTRCRELFETTLRNVNSPIRRFYRKVSQYERQLTKKKSELDRQLKILRRQSLKQFNHLRQLNVGLERIIDPVINKMKVLDDDKWIKSGGEMKKNEKKRKDTSDKKIRLVVTPLSLAITSLTLIETQLDQITIFWENIHNQLVKYKNGIPKKNMYMIMYVYEDLLEFGYSWIAIGSVLQESVEFVILTQESVDMAVMRIYTADDLKQMINLEAKNSLKVLNRLSYRCREECKDCFNEDIGEY